MPELGEFVWPVAGWYLAVQLCTAAALPFCLSFFYSLPDRGYALAKICGVLAVGYLLWMGTALGLLRNETGGAWLALALAAGLSLLYARTRGTVWKDIDRSQLGTQIVWVEALFLVALVGWAYVRAHDPAANHTEQPMDLMFLNSIWHSPTFPPQDAWLAGYAISYYYFGYWLLAAMARLANTPPEIAYNAGQAAWFGLLVVSCYGIGYNLLSFRVAINRLESPIRNIAAKNWQLTSRLGGLFAVCGVALAGNLQAILEWLYANGVLGEQLARWVSVNNFPDNAVVTGQWYIGLGGWWWWRTSRVISDRNLAGGHIEVIDEFPMFSYVLGDNHPHVLAMPVALLVIGIAMHLLFAAYLSSSTTSGAATAPRESSGNREAQAMSFSLRARSWMAALDCVPGGFMTIVIAALPVGSLLFLNTWDFPPYWGLLILSGAAAMVWSAFGQHGGRGGLMRHAAVIGAVVLVGALLYFAPYLITAQSQAGGIMPNFFNPTRIQQFLVMFGAWAPATLLFLWVGVRTAAPAGNVWLWAVILVIGAPVIFLVATAAIALGTEGGRAALAQMPLPQDATGYGSIMLDRWLRQGYTFLAIGAALAGAVATLWAWFVPGQSSGVAALRTHDPAAHARLGFALLLLLCALILVFIPEFVFLRDQFGTRMNTVFKFYYQAWLLWGLAGAYIVVEQLRGGTLPSLQGGDGQTSWAGSAWGHLPALGSLGLVLACLIFPITAPYSKTGGFAANPLTLDATQYIEGPAPAVAAAVRWIREYTPGNARILEAEGRAYSAEHNRVSTMTGRPTLLGWTGHQRQWRGDAYAEMAAGRTEAVAAIYQGWDPVEERNLHPTEVGDLLMQWEIDYIYVSPVERREYQMSDVNEATLASVSTLVFEMGDVRIYRVARMANGGDNR